MEIGNRFISLRRWITHGGFPYQALRDLEWYTEILCARANVHLVCPAGKMPTFDLFPSRDEMRRRILVLRDLYYPQHPPAIFSLQPKKAAVPTPEHAALWRLLCGAFPVNDQHFSVFLQRRADEQLHRVHGAHLGEALFAYGAVHLGHQFPDARAMRLYTGHFVLFIEFGLGDHEGKLVGLVQGTVHGSERTNKLHWPTIRLLLPSTAESFSLLTHACTCESGCAIGIAKHPPHCCCRRDGVCSHLQALLMVLSRVRQKALPIVR